MKTPASAIFFLFLLLLSCNFNKQEKVATTDIPVGISELDSLASYFDKSILYFTAGTKDSAMLFANKTLELAQTTKNEKFEAIAENMLGKVYYSLCKYDRALEHTQNSLKYYEKENNKRGMFVIYNDLGTIYSKSRNKEMAMYYFQLAEKIGEEVGNMLQLAHIYTNYVQVYIMDKDYPSALEYGRLAADIFRENSNSYLLSFALEALAEVYSYMGDYQNELKCSEECLQIAEELGMEGRMVSALNALARAQLDMKQYAKSEASALRALQIDSIGTVTRDLLLTLTKNYMMTNNHSKASHYLEKYDNHLFTFLDDDYRQRASELEVIYETEKKELEIEQQRHIIDRQKMQRALLAVSVAICTLFLVLLWYMLHLRSRRNRALTERNDALAEINATKDKFFSIISHDLKNPAIAQREALQQLLDNGDLWDKETLKKYYHRLTQSSDRQLSLLYNLLNWAKTQTGRMPCQPVLFDVVAELRKNEIPLLRELADRKEITLVSEMPDAALVTGDDDMLLTVVRNLMGNAIKFTPAGGSVTLSVKPDENGKFIISVADTGVGMTAEQKQNLFSPDRRASRRGTAGEQGSGLGLLVCRELLEKHGSALHIESEEGKGSRFWFEV